MYRKYVHNGITWYDLHSPNAEEVKEISQLYGLESSVIRHLMSSSHKNNFVASVGYERISLHVPSCVSSGRNQTSRQRMNFVLARDYVLSVRFSDIKGIKKAKKILEQDRTLDSAHDIFACISEQIFAAIDKDVLQTIPRIIQEGSLYDHKKMVTDYSRTVRRNESTLHAYGLRHGEKARRSIDSLQQSINNIDSQKKIQLDLNTKTHSGVFEKIKSLLGL